MLKNDKKLFSWDYFKSDDLPFVEAKYCTNSKRHYEKHFHESLSIGAVEEGEISYICEEKEYILLPNQLSIIEPNALHCCNPSSEDARTYYMIYVDADWCEQIQKTLFDNVDGFVSFKDAHCEDKGLFDEFLRLNKTLLDRRVFYLEKEELLESFFIKLFKKYCHKSPKILIKPDTDKINKVKDFMQSNCAENLTLDEIARNVDVSKFYLSRMFKKEVHISVHKYLLNCKINQAKKLLYQEYSSSQIALMLGFFDQSHFISTFKKYIALTPNEYKASLLS